MNQSNLWKTLLVSYAILMVVMFVLPFFSTKDYSILLHTTSQLGAQNTPNAWIMNCTFALMGTTTILVGWNHYRTFFLHRVFLVVFGSSLVLAAIYRHAPIPHHVEFSIREDELHSVFATTTGFGFTLLAISTGFIKANKKKCLVPFMAGILATMFSLMMFSFEDYAGVFQRLIFIFSFAWLLFEFRNSPINS